MEMTEVKVLGIIGVAAIASMTISTCVKALSNHKKEKEELRNKAEKLDAVIERYTSKADFDIDQMVIDKAVDKVIERKFDYALEKAVETKVNVITREVVKEQKNSIKQRTQDALDSKLRNLDINDIKEEAIEKAAELASEKLETALENTLTQFNKDIKTAQKAYERRLNNTSGIQINI